MPCGPTPLGREMTQLSCGLVEQFSEKIEELKHPSEVVRALEKDVAAQIGILVYAMWLIPPTEERLSRYTLGRNIFSGPNVPEAFWSVFWPSYAINGTSCLARHARTNPGPFTWTEGMRLLRPVGTDRWQINLAAEYGMRDGLHCPQGHVLVVYASTKTKIFKPTRTERIVLNHAAGLAADHFRQWMMSQKKQLERRPTLSNNERKALLRYSLGDEPDEIAKRLECGVGTVHTYLERARKKLNAKNRQNAVHIATLKGDV
jgi:DNA-binding CsgD family transcriptional regulator